jgi:hypothetical protein
MTGPMAVDALAWTIKYLDANLPGVLVTAELPADVDDRLPAIRVRRSGGGDDGVAIDSPVMVIDVYAGTQAFAQAVAANAGMALLAGRGAVLNGGTLLRATKVAGPIYAHDPNPNLRRAVVTYELRLKAA